MGAVDDYLASVDDAGDRQVLTRVYEVAREVVPDAEQGTGYRMPALKYRGKVLLSAIRAAKHIGVYPFSAAAIAAVAGQTTGLDGVDVSTGTIRFAPGVSVPDDLIRALVSFRAAEIEG